MGCKAHQPGRRRRRTGRRRTRAQNNRAVPAAPTLPEKEDEANEANETPSVLESAVSLLFPSPISLEEIEKFNEMLSDIETATAIDTAEEEEPTPVRTSDHRHRITEGLEEEMYAISDEIFGPR